MSCLDYLVLVREQLLTAKTSEPLASQRLDGVRSLKALGINSYITSFGNPPKALYTRLIRCKFKRVAS